MMRSVALTLTLSLTGCGPSLRSSNAVSSGDGCAPPEPSTLMNCRSYGDPKPTLPAVPTDADVARLLQGDDCYEVTTLAEHADAVAPGLARLATSSSERHLRDRAIIVLGELRCRQHADVVERHATSDDPVTRGYAERALENLR